MKLNIVVLAKQVPDTRNVGKDAMTAEGTVNRAVLPAIFNPEDLNALEQALRIKDLDPENIQVGIVTMGPPRAGEIIRQGLYRGADCGWLLTDRKSAGADTLATSYFLSKAIEKIGKEIDSDYDAVIQGGGYDHNWVIKDYNGELRLAAKAKDENSKRVMEVYADLPGVQFYTGNYLTEEIVGKRGVTYPKRSGYCFETQFFPNAVNMPEFIQPVVDELEEFISETVYKFSVERD